MLATFLMLADRLTLDGDDGELPAVFDEFVDFLKVPGGLVALPELPFPCLDREEWLTLCWRGVADFLEDLDSGHNQSG